MRIDDRRANRDALSESQFLGHRLRQLPSDLARSLHPARHLSPYNVYEFRVDSPEKRLRGKTVPRSPHALVACLTGRASHFVSLAPDQLPYDPVACLNPHLSGAVDFRRLVQGLEHLGEEPFESDRSAALLQELLPALVGYLVNPVSLALGPMVLPQLRPRKRIRLVLGKQAQRRAVRKRREHRATGEVDTDSDNAGGCIAHAPPSAARRPDGRF